MSRFSRWFTAVGLSLAIGIGVGYGLRTPGHTLEVIEPPPAAKFVAALPACDMSRWFETCKFEPEDDGVPNGEDPLDYSDFDPQDADRFWREFLENRGEQLADELLIETQSCPSSSQAYLKISDEEQIAKKDFGRELAFAFTSSYYHRIMVLKDCDFSGFHGSLGPPAGWFSGSSPTDSFEYTYQDLDFFGPPIPPIPKSIKPGEPLEKYVERVTESNGGKLPNTFGGETVESIIERIRKRPESKATEKLFEQCSQQTQLFTYPVRAERNPLYPKHGEEFVIMNNYGDQEGFGDIAGIYKDGTVILCKFLFSKFKHYFNFVTEDYTVAKGHHPFFSLAERFEDLSFQRRSRALTLTDPDEFYGMAAWQQDRAELHWDSAVQVCAMYVADPMKNPIDNWVKLLHSDVVAYIGYEMGQIHFNNIQATAELLCGPKKD